MPSETAQSKIIVGIVVGVAVALITGGTAPWWWNRVFSPNPVSPSPSPFISSPAST